jgi:hypothetical protein
VAVDAAAHGHDAEHLLQVKLGEFGRQQILGEDDRRRADLLAGDVNGHQAAEHAVADVDHVAAALRLIWIIETLVRVRHCLYGALPRRLGVEVLAGDLAQRQILERVILQHQAVRVEDCRLAGADARRDIVAQLAQVVARGVDGRFEPALLLVHVADAPLGHRRQLEAHMHDRGDGDARRNRHPRQHLHRRWRRHGDGGGGRGVQRRRDRVAKIIFSQRFDGHQRLSRFRAGGIEGERVALARAQCRHAVHAVGAHGAPVRRHLDVRGKAIDHCHQPRHRPCVHAQLIGHLDGERQRWRCRWRRRVVFRPQRRRFEQRRKLVDLGRQRLLRFGVDARNGCAAHGLRRSRDCAFHQRPIAEVHMLTALLRQQFDRGLGAHQRAAQVHQNQHAVVAVNLVDGGQHLDRVGADHMVRAVEAGGDGNLRAPAHHLLDQFEHTARQRRAVGY